MLGSVAAADVLTFWFGQLDADGCADDVHRDRWFGGGERFDQEIAERFDPLIERAVHGDLPRPTDASERLAWILVLDQFTRNTRRGSAAAFAGDERARAMARRGIELGEDRQLGLDERAFFYLPFEHSEDLIDQHTAVGLFHLLHAEAPTHRRNISGNVLRYAERHRAAILRFGRFPHRNAVLGRQSSEAEQAYLDDGGGFS